MQTFQVQSTKNVMNNEIFIDKKWFLYYDKINKLKKQFDDIMEKAGWPKILNSN